MSRFENINPVAAAARFTNQDHWMSGGAQWPSGEQQLLECCAVRQETQDVRTFTFRCPAYPSVSFEPGQFITVSPVINGQSDSRCYTISSAPTRPFTLSITVKRVSGGTVSNWLHDNLQPGSRLLASGPAGNFTPVSKPAGKLLYLSAGSGVTPLMSMLRSSADLFADLDIAFVHSARTPGDIVFRDELATLASTCRHLRVVHICERIDNESDWTGPLGRLDLALLQRAIPDFLEREVFTCGPKGYMDAIKALLTSAGFDDRHYHQESFDITAVDGDTVIEPALAETQSVTSFSVRLARSGKTFNMSNTETILVAAKKAGAIVPSSCSQGVCGTCKTAVLEGSVQMNHNGGIRQREIDRGLRLLCCSKPTSDLVIDL